MSCDVAGLSGPIGTVGFGMPLLTTLHVMGDNPKCHVRDNHVLT
jgi:hypothetical protein